MALVMLASCSENRPRYNSPDDYPVREGSLSEMEYDPLSTQFHLWSPDADEVRLMLYEEPEGGHAYENYPMEQSLDGTWHVTVQGDLNGRFYTFNVKKNDMWLGDTPGIFAKAVGINGYRAAIIDLRTTDPDGWQADSKPRLTSLADAVVYELHYRDFSMHPSSGITNKGKYLSLTEWGTKSADSLSTGLQHLAELGVTHVHLLPSFDYASIDEHTLDKNHYNWGYDPQNYNVPEGSYSTDPYDPALRIREFKQMVQALHSHGLRVVLDVVYNHTYDAASSNFERTVPGYFYRQTAEGSYADGSGCGNETASNRPMMRKFMIESVQYWMREYHIDGFRFDLMGIHDIVTMNQIADAARAIDPQVLLYGEGWAAQTPAYIADSLAMKANMQQMPGIAAFGDELRDALRGPWNDDAHGAFLAGEAGHEASIKFGIVGAIDHPQVPLDSVNYSHTAWAEQPTQMMAYVSCHDDMCLVDRLSASISGVKPGELESLDMLGQTAVLISQGIPFIFGGEELMRDKKGVHNSYRSPDDVNAIDWHNKAVHAAVYEYYRNLIALRRHHPAFHLGNADLVRQHLEFLPVEGSGVVAFRLKDHAGGDKWSDIYVVLNARREVFRLDLPQGKYQIVCQNGRVDENGLGMTNGQLTVTPMSAMIVCQE